jgi:hypothetical protein
MNTLSAIRTTNQIVGRIAPGMAARMARRLLM